MDPPPPPTHHLPHARSAAASVPLSPIDPLPLSPNSPPPLPQIPPPTVAGESVDGVPGRSTALEDVETRPAATRRLPRGKHARGRGDEDGQVAEQQIPARSPPNSSVPRPPPSKSSVLTRADRAAAVAATCAVAGTLHLSDSSWSRAPWTAFSKQSRGGRLLGDDDLDELCGYIDLEFGSDKGRNRVRAVRGGQEQACDEVQEQACDEVQERA